MTHIIKLMQNARLRRSRPLFKINRSACVRYNDAQLMCDLGSATAVTSLGLCRKLAEGMLRKSSTNEISNLLSDASAMQRAPIRPEDEPLWLEMFQSFSDESIRYRFFQMLKDTPHEVRVRYCNIAYDREIAIVAELTEEGRRKILGVSQLGIEPDGKSGEMAS